MKESGITAKIGDTRRILVVGGITRSLVNFRGALLRRMVQAGCSVHAAAGEPSAQSETELAEMGVAFHPLPLARAGLNPLNDMRVFVNLLCLMRRIHPDVVLAYTVKPVVYGGLAARCAGVPEIYSLITGLGYAFADTRTIKQRVVSAFVQRLYRPALRASRRVFFQNRDDRELFIQRGFVTQEQAILVNGSGVDLLEYAVAPLPESPVFLMIARLLVEKGVREYVEAARQVKAEWPSARFLLVGGLEPGPDVVGENELQDWRNSGVIEPLGRLPDVRPVLERCRVYVLPSYYREGLPRTILEAMSMGRPVITVDSPGCRETIVGGEDHAKVGLADGIQLGENGILVPPRNAAALAQAMKEMLRNPGRTEAMAKAARRIAEERFDVHEVNRIMLSAMGLDR